jgi:predicted Rossmann fold flavoprotein
MPSTKLIAVVGAGAAGLLAAIHAAAQGCKVLLLERNADGGRKILISGGGRCNVLPGRLAEDRFVTSSSMNSLRKILRSWPHAEMRAFFEEEADLPLRLEESTGKLFPVADKSRAVRDALRALADRRGVIFRGRTEVKSLTPIGEGGWRLGLSGGDSISADAVILATGGLSVPQTGSDGFGLKTLAALGHTVHPTYPALTPLTQSPARFADLAGVSLTATVRARSEVEDRVATGGFLFTHQGYSGPALLDVSHVAVRARLAQQQRAGLTVAWGGYGRDYWEQLLRPAAGTVGSVIRKQLPTRLAERLLVEAGVAPDTALSQLDKASLSALMTVLTAFPLPWTSDEGYKKAEVTGGGVALGEVQPTTLESRILPGLFLAGELLDAFGPIGGYNFTWAWVTGRLAGLGAGKKSGS